MSARNFFLGVNSLMHSVRIDAPNNEMHVGYIMPNAGGSHIDFSYKKIKLGTDLKSRTSEMMYGDPSLSGQAVQSAEYYLDVDMQKEVVNQIHRQTDCGTLAFQTCSWWRRVLAKYFNRKIIVKLRNPAQASSFLHNLVSRHRIELWKAGQKNAKQFILCGPEQALAFEMAPGFRYFDEFSKMDFNHFQHVIPMGDFRGVRIFIEPNHVSDYIVIGHKPDREKQGTCIVYTDPATTRTLDKVTVKMQVGFVDFGPATKYYAVALNVKKLSNWGRLVK